VFSAVLTWLGWGILKDVYADEYATTATLQIPEWYFYAILPLVGCMMFVRTLIVMWEDLFSDTDTTDSSEKTEEPAHG
jgi:TRAP-type C4-dicarboxylate transport system permease small subunit